MENLGSGGSMKVMNMLGIEIDCLAYEDMYPIFDGWLADKGSRSHAIAVINVHICVSALKDKMLRDMYNSVDLSGSDGKPFLMWARAFHNKHSDRFYAPDLMHEISRKAGEKSYTYFLYGGYPGANEKIEAYLKERYDGIHVVGKYTPPFRPLTDAEDREFCAMVNQLQPDFIWVGLGSPKQDVWIRDHLESIRGSILMPSGATFDFFSGRIRQAPKWIRESGFEWFYRLTQDFSRLWKRYTVYNIIFLTFFILQLTKIVSFDDEGYLLFLGRRTKFGN
jgi:N-acetylglucosaminyldiphosphoundecaprenol N-acetyl-beta-D-mannosaminyltransferase